MMRGIDHLVVAVHDPDGAAEELARMLGLAFTGGGRHPGAGTFNRVAFLGDAYLELIGIEDRRAAERHPIGAAAIRALEGGGGLATYALADDEIESNVASLQAAGSSIGPVERGSRRRPDGEEMTWWRASFAELAPDRPPFLIRHDPTGAESGAAALRERAEQVHPLGSPVILVRLDIATQDPPSLAAGYFRELGLEFWAVADLAVCSIGQHTIRLRPSGQMPVPAAVVLGAEVEAPRSLQALGMQLDIEPVDLPAPWRRQGRKGTTPLPGEQVPRT